MTFVSALFFDGKTAKGQLVTIEAKASVACLVIYDQHHNRLKKLPLAEIQISEHFSNAPRRLTFKDDTYCEVDDQDKLDQLLGSIGYRQPFVSSFKGTQAAFISLAVTLLVLIGGYFWGLPMLSEFLAYQVPVNIEKEIAKTALDNLDQYELAPSKLPKQIQQKIIDSFHALVPPDKTEYDYQILFRSGQALGPNAFALPGGIIVITDDLVTLTEKKPELFNGLLGVLAHEAGHIENRHGLRQALHATAVSATVTYLFGDVSALAVAVPTALLTTQYSREEEREADQYAINLLKAQKIPIMPLAETLLAIEAYYKDHAPGLPGGDLFSTHPLTHERVATIKEQSKP